MSDTANTRLATLVAIAEKQPGLGRTAAMKLCYLLQTLRRVPLGYRFTLYSYGPFDPGVLSDLSSAEALGGIESKTILYSGGYGYAISPSARSKAVKALAADFINKHRSDLNWVVDRFGKFGSADLEILSTIVYVDREAKQANERLTPDKLADRVHDLKPRFATDYILEKLGSLREQKLLKSVRQAPGSR